ncbi:Bug family tripartite tricarboxylate transporter substrate binding protein [Hydrogenophaga atypica]|uniref:Bug family tripartite tricarboxylate transporter substrate binding protein n=1 Tax=Hydrogenophaga atypica TaxID=249409 RepID=A0ABW2QNL4_9BURK
MQRRHILRAGAFGLALTSPLSLLAQAPFPTRPVKLVVPFAAGGGPDVLARRVAGRLGQALGQSVVVENIVGAGGILAAQSVARAPADGYVVMLGASTHITQKAMQPSVRFDPIKDFTHIGRTLTSPQLLVVAADSPYKTLQDLVDAARKAPGTLNYASGGVGSAAHLSGAALGHALGLDVVHVPYKGSVEIVPSIMQGATHFGFPVVSTAVGLLQQGKVRALATTGSARLAALPQVPTLKEVTGKDELMLDAWSGIWAPAGLPAAVADVWFKALQQVYADPTVRAEHEAAGTLVALSSSPAEFTRFIEAETVKYQQLVKATGLSNQ